jgi:NAD(P)-dependent dehydrogenase (short-subunit alcohol dehydrogenase family)
MASSTPSRPRSESPSCSDRQSLWLGAAPALDSRRPGSPAPRELKASLRPAIRTACTRLASNSGPASRPLTPLTLTGWKSSSMRCPRRSITCWSPALVPTMRRWQNSTSKRRTATSTPISSCQYRSLATRWAKFGRDGTLVFMGGTGGRRAAPGLYFLSALSAALPALTKNLALELAPVRVNLIAAGFVDTPLSATRLGHQLDTRREQLRTNLPIRRVVGPADIAALAVHLMTNTAVTGATFDIDGGQQLVER